MIADRQAGLKTIPLLIGAKNQSVSSISALVLFLTIAVFHYFNHKSMDNYIIHNFLSANNCIFNEKNTKFAIIIMEFLTNDVITRSWFSGYILSI